METPIHTQVYNHFIRGSIIQLIGYIGVSITLILGQLTIFGFKFPTLTLWGTLLLGSIIMVSYMVGQLFILIGILEWIRGSKLLLKHVDKYSYLNIGWKTFMAGVIFSLPLPVLFLASYVWRLGNTNTFYSLEGGGSISILENITITSIFSGMVGLLLIGIGYIIFALFLYEIGSEFSNNVKLKYGGLLLLIGAVLLFSVIVAPLGSMLTLVGLTFIIVGFKEVLRFHETGEIGEFII